MDRDDGLFGEENRVIKLETLEIQQKRKNLKRRITYIVLVALGLVSFLVVMFVFFFKINSFAITGNTKYDADEIIAAIPVNKGDSLFTFDSNAVEQSVLTGFPYVKSVKISRKLPSTVCLEIEEETPVFCLVTDTDRYLIAGDFKVLERMEPSDEAEQGVIILKTGYVKRCIAGEKLSFAETKLITSLEEFWKTATENGINEKIDYIEAANRFDIYFGYDDKLRVYLGSVTDCDVKLTFFRGILEHLDDNKANLDISDKKEAVLSPVTSE